MCRPDENYLAYQDGEMLYVLPDPAVFSDPRVQVAISLRNQATLANVCPVCGARGPNRAQRRKLMRDERAEITSMLIVHAAECPAADENVCALIAQTERAA